MAKIYWLVYIVVGLLVSALSYRLDYQKLIFFFYIGLIFIVVGIAKLIFGSANKNTSKAQNVQHKAHHQLQNIKYCHNCGTALRLQTRFCSRCGARV